MIPSIEILSLSVNRLKSGVPFEKYHIDVSIDEAESNESSMKLKYKFVILSTPTNAKISIEGFTTILGTEPETVKYLEPDEKKVPQIVNIVYGELLPLLYVLTKSLDIPCPAYKISQISQTAILPDTISDQVQKEPQIQAKQESEATKEEIVEAQTVEVPSEQSPSQELDPLDELEKFVEGQNVSSL